MHPSSSLHHSSRTIIVNQQTKINSPFSTIPIDHFILCLTKSKSSPYNDEQPTKPLFFHSIWKMDERIWLYPSRRRHRHRRVNVMRSNRKNLV